MNWDEIERKWAAMARRARTDLPVAGAPPERKQNSPPTPPGDLPEPPLPEAAQNGLG